MRGVHLFLIIVTLPLLAAFGHDVYLFYKEHGMNNVIADYERVAEEKGPMSLFASLGFIWTQYDEEGYKTAVQSMSEEDWAQVNTLLAQKAVVVTGAFAGFFYVLALLLKILGLWPFNENRGVKTFSRGKGSDPVHGRKNPTRVKYKRK